MQTALAIVAHAGVIYMQPLFLQKAGVKTIGGPLPVALPCVISYGFECALPLASVV